MRIVFLLLVVFAAFLTTSVIGLTIFSIAIGGGSVLFPGLGLVVSLPFLIVLLAIVDAAVITLALHFRRMSKRKFQ